jgi:hypothetical protein
MQPSLPKVLFGAAITLAVWIAIAQKGSNDVINIRTLTEESSNEPRANRTEDQEDYV